MNDAPDVMKRPALTPEAYWALKRAQGRLNNLATGQELDLSETLLVVLAAAEQCDDETLRELLR